MIHFDLLGLGEIAIRTLAVYIILMIGLRLAGKRELGQMSVLELVLILLIANGVQNAMIGFDTSLSGGVVAALTLLTANAVVSRFVARTEWLQHAVRGTPSMLVNHGQVIADHMRREAISTDELMMAIREHGIERLEDVKMAVIEVDGTISIVPREATHYRTRTRIGRTSL